MWHYLILVSNRPRQVERGIDSMSKGVNSGLLSGRANRGDSSDGDSNGDPEDHQHGDQLDLFGSSQKECTVLACQSISSVFFANAVHVAE